MIERVRLLLKNDDVYKSFIVTASLFVSSIFSYLLQLSLGRFLTISEYGEFGVLLSLSIVFSIPINAFITSVIKMVSDLKAKGEYEAIKSLLPRLIGIVSTIGILVSLLVVFSQSFVLSYLNLEKSDMVLFFSIYLGVSFLIIPPFSYLQGLSRFKAFSFLSVAASVLRFAIPSFFAFLGLGVSGVYLGMSFSTILSFLLGLLFLRESLFGGWRNGMNGEYGKLLQFGVASFLINIGMVLLNNVDVILVKHFFDGVSAGLYLVSVTVGKVILFGAGSVSVVMFPQVSEAYAKGGDVSKRLKPFFIIQLTLALVSVLMFFTFPDFFVGLLFGERFLKASFLIPAFSVFMGLYVMINFMVMFFLAINKGKVFLFQFPAVFLQFVLISLYHESLLEVVIINISISLLLLLAIVLYYMGYVGIGNRSVLQAGEDN
ncbi:hypothetical protein A2716_03695 [candidate division WWE3 bacterium RIFCSPHIGHO2_01_FULL_40_23]|uniref:Polysaccharide biosynthesis protein C-terminal domain-containing protein n=1 Tax=candidate division WWE3 bacterium RIFCSPLOWO2_01_FULL_41_18 TaxID=1802625 RepID=A0A1F4VCK5_UNCKA|nr:MAG: hypothetical protein A2716_03695 [candidate division WWE3 bacterium RIFCSPHIGHO2_01_FULL_40_23]OGC54982.1 MAG: hypothetical protein A3A78_03305 [candidate division WWE3 bacterium RIFCSPLOWO2_01_FULL_41_18]